MRSYLVLGLALSLTLAACVSSPPAEEPAQPTLSIPATTRAEHRPLFLAHTMTWFEAPPTSGAYGWHWHMGSLDPYTVSADGSRPVATHYPPLIGPYDSADPKVLEYQLLTMKAAGIDGVIVDWYGIDDALDYKAIHKATQALFDAVRKAGMTFAVCYEDQSIGKMVLARTISADQAVARAVETFRWMEDHWFNDPAYLKFDGRPVVLDFGPQYFTRWSDWTTILAPLAVKPWFVSLENHSEHDADGFYNWPEMSKSVNGVLSLGTLIGQLNAFYAKTKDAPRLVASAWPGFHDYYAQAGVASSYGFLDDYSGATFDLTLGAALSSRPDVIQLATWNDYGEGTVLEPNKTRGYGPLQSVQKARKDADAAFPFSSDDLKVPLALYGLRGTTGADSKALDAAARAFFAGDPRPARSLTAAPLPQAQTTAPSAAAQGVGPQVPPGAVNLAYGKRTKASSHVFDFTADRTTDGEVLTYWEGGAATYPNELSVDFGAVKAVKRLILRLNPKRIWGARTQEIEVLGSKDGESFDTLVPAKVYTFDPETSGNAIEIAVDGQWQALKLRITANSGGKAGQIAEWEVYGP